MADLWPAGIGGGAVEGAMAGDAVIGTIVAGAAIPGVMTAGEAVVPYAGAQHGSVAGA